ncbi:glutathione transferase [Ranunculus cassubicifolius]
MAAILKVHGAPMCTCTAIVLTCLHEKGLEFELVPVDMSVAEHKQPSFLSKNPFGQIPSLEC